MKREAYHPCLQANRDDKILFYPTEEKPQENYPPPLARSPSLFCLRQNRDDKLRCSGICHLLLVTWNLCAFFTIDCVKYFNFTVFCLYLALFFLIETWFYAVWEFLLIMIKKLIKYGVKLFRFTFNFVKSLCIFLFWLYICSFWRMENMQ